MLTVDGDLVSGFTVYTSTALVAFLPLLASVIGVFVAFAIFDRMQYSISRSVKK